MKRLTLIIVFLLTIAEISFADGFVLPRPRPWLPLKPRVNVKYHHVDVKINDPAAVIKIDQVFVNPYEREIEADYFFPLPDDAVINRFTAYLGGHKMEAELLDAKQARKVYEDIVRRRKDPALLEYAGKGMYRLRLFPMPPHEEVRVKIEYEQTLKSDYGTVEYLYPLNTEKYSGALLDDCRIEVDINSFENIGAVYCATHDIDTERINEKHIKAVYYKKNYRPDRDFILYFTRQTIDFGFHMISYGDKNDDKGYFLGILSPPFQRNNIEIDKNILFVLDTSGSMRGEKIEQAKEALQFCLLGLNSGDYFNIITYAEHVRPYNQEFLSAGKENIDNAVGYAKGITSNGGTNIYEALKSACQMIPSNKKPTYIIFLTDGLPTVGITNINKIISNTTKVNEGRARLFVFGVGYDVNAHLLDRLAEENNGVPEYVLPKEDIEVKVSHLFSKISYPVLTDIKLKFDKNKIYNVYPKPLPDLFHGSEILLAGRFDKIGKDKAFISGKVNDRKITYEFKVEFNEGSSKDDFIALLWANRRIGYLLQQIRLHGSSDELLDEVIALSKKFGILTEYTSFLVTGDGDLRAEDIQRLPKIHARGALKKQMDTYGSLQSGESAVRQSQGLANQQGFVRRGRGVGEVVYRTGKTVSYADRITQVGSQGFFRSDENWVQGDIVGDSIDVEIKLYSTAYFQILEKDPSLGQYLALGDQVRLKIGSQIVQISDIGKESLTEKELRSLFQ
ncbi:MAG: VWA domain-containing protein [candidate division Zixibacteria bacterium]|nr:VWA domain-containing protein [candidate division Zixibacteria bacterium]